MLQESFRRLRKVLEGSSNIVVENRIRNTSQRRSYGLALQLQFKAWCIAATGAGD